VNEKLSWLIDLTVIEWLPVLIMLAVLVYAGGIIRRRISRATGSAAGQTDKAAGDSIPWHARGNAQVFAQIDAGPEGLAAGEVTRRLEQYGPNRLPEARARERF